MFDRNDENEQTLRLCLSLFKFATGVFRPIKGNSVELASTAPDSAKSQPYLTKQQIKEKFLSSLPQAGERGRKMSWKSSTDVSTLGPSAAMSSILSVRGGMKAPVTL